MSDRKLRPHHHVLYRIGQRFLSAAGRLPLTVTRPVGGMIGQTAMALSSRDRRRSRDHIRLAFPDLDEAQVRRLLQANARHFGAMLAEVGWLLQASPEQVGDLCEIQGREHIDRPLQAGTGVVLITGHCGNWELLNARLGVAGIPLTIAVRSIYDPRLDNVATTLRSRFGTDVVARGREAGRRLASALIANRVVGLLIDQDIRDIPGVFVDFFGHPARTPSGAASLALHRGCPVVPAFGHRRADGSHIVEVGPPLPEPGPGSTEDRVRELTAAATAAIERQVRSHPEQWVWLHRRWRTQPPTPGGDVGR
jgi:KDO2-lipid IV(A) lauroyltransferase